MTVCRQCGELVANGNAICAMCGSQPRESISHESAGIQRFCTRCGAPNAGTNFCVRCGFSGGLPSPAKVAPSTAADIARPLVSDSDAAFQVDGRSAIPTSVVVFGVAAILTVVLIGGIWFVVHRARQRAGDVEARHSLERSLPDVGRSGSIGKSGEQQSTDGFKKNLIQLAAAGNALAQSGPTQEANTDASENSSQSALANGPSAGAAASSPQSVAPNGWSEVNGKLVPSPPPQPLSLPKKIPIVPVAATGEQTHDWALEYERTINGPEADLVVRTGDINNLGFGWKYYDWNTKQLKFLDPFSGQSSQPHQWPDIHRIPPNAPAGTDRIMLGSAVIPGVGDGYSGAIGDCIEERQLAKSGQIPPQISTRCKEERALTAPAPIVLLVGSLPGKIHEAVLQLFVDDFQPAPMHSHFQVILNGTRIPNFEYAINALDQSGPIGKLLTLKLLPEYWPLLKSGTVNLLIDDPTTHVPDGYAVDFVRILVNPHPFKYQVSLSAKVMDADKHTPISGATVTAALESKAVDNTGKCNFSGLPAGLVIATANAPGYDESSAQVDLSAGQTGEADIQLHRHEETTAALEQSIAQSGTVNLYGIRFDTGSSKLRADSIPALRAVFGLIKAHPSSQWIVAGHTDNQGSDALNIPLSKARGESVVFWLATHGGQRDHLIPMGFGATRPVSDNSTPSGRALNRRVEITLAK